MAAEVHRLRGVSMANEGSNPREEIAAMNEKLVAIQRQHEEEMEGVFGSVCMRVFYFLGGLIVSINLTEKIYEDPTILAH